MSGLVKISKAVKGHPIRIGLAFTCILLFVGLKSWDYRAPLSVHDWNEKELTRIKVADPDDFTFAVLGDNKGNRSLFEPLLKDINHDLGIVFAIDVGDLVPSGERGLYRRFLKQVQENLTIPFLTAIGNHDLYRGSSNNYRNILGPTYYSFQLGHSYFIVLEATTEGGFNEEERQWLEEELKKANASKTRFAFMHVPPFDPRGNGFHKCLPERDRDDLLDLFRRNKMTHIFASHIHGYFSGVREGVPYSITGGAGGRLQGDDPKHFFHHYLKVHVHNGRAEVRVKRIDEKGGLVRFFDFLRGYFPEAGFLLAAGILVGSLFLSVGRGRFRRQMSKGDVS